MTSLVSSTKHLNKTNSPKTFPEKEEKGTLLHTFLSLA